MYCKTNIAHLCPDIRSWNPNWNQYFSSSFAGRGAFEVWVIMKAYEIRWPGEVWLPGCAREQALGIPGTCWRIWSCRLKATLYWLDSCTLYMYFWYRPASICSRHSKGEALISLLEHSVGPMQVPHMSWSKSIAADSFSTESGLGASLANFCSSCVSMPQARKLHVSCSYSCRALRHGELVFRRGQGEKTQGRITRQWLRTASYTGANPWQRFARLHPYRKRTGRAVPSTKSFEDLANWENQTKLRAPDQTMASLQRECKCSAYVHWVEWSPWHDAFLPETLSFECWWTYSFGYNPSMCILKSQASTWFLVVPLRRQDLDLLGSVFWVRGRVSQSSSPRSTVLSFFLFYCWTSISPPLLRRTCFQVVVFLADHAAWRKRLVGIISQYVIPLLGRHFLWAAL